MYLLPQAIRSTILVSRIYAIGMTLNSALLRLLFATVFQNQQDRLLYNSLPVPHLQLDRRGTVLSANDFTLETLGCDRADLVGQSIERWLGERERAIFARLLETLKPLETPSSVRHQIQQKNGRRLWVKARLSAVSLDDGDTRILLVWEDLQSIPEQVESCPYARDCYELALDCSHVGIWDWHLISGAVYLSPNLCRGELTEEAEETKILEPLEVFLQSVHPNDRATVTQAVRRYLSGETNTYRIEHRKIGPDGQTRWFLSCGRLVYDDSGRAVQFVGSDTDITDRKQAEDDLYDLAKRLLAVIETIDDGITLSDEAGTFGIFNQKMEEITGYCATEANTCQDFLAQLYPDTEARREALDRLIAVREQGGLRNVETTVRVKDGSFKRLLVSTTYLRLSVRDGTTETVRYCYLSTYRDITDRYLAHEALRQSQQLMEAVANTSPQLLYIVNLKLDEEVGTDEEIRSLQIAYINRQIFDLLGYNPQIPLQQDYWIFDRTWHPDDVPRLRQYVRDWRQADDGEVREIEYRLRHADGSWHWFRSRDVVFQRNADGIPLQVLGTATDITKRKQVEQQLQERESQLNTVVNSTSDGIVILDRDGVVRFANAAATRLLDRTSDTLIGSEFGRPLVFDEPMEIEIVRPTGRCLDVEIVAAETQWSSAPAYAVSLRDISRRRYAETRLRESELRFRQLADNIESVFWLRDLQRSSTLYVSPAYERIWQRSCPQIYDYPDDWFEAIHPDDRPRVLAAIEQASSGVSIEVEYRIIRPDGLRWIHDRAFPVRDEQGNITRLAGLAEDISERKHVEAALRASEAALRASQERLNDILQSLDDLVWSLCAQTSQLLYVSPALQRIYGRSPIEFGENSDRWIQTVHDLDRDRFQQAWKELFDGEAFDLEYRIVRPDRTVRWLRGRARLVRDERGYPLRVDGITSDITELKQAEIAVREGEERFRNLVANVPGAIYRCLPSRCWKTVFVSDAIERITGYPTESFLNCPTFWQQIIHPDDLDGIADAIDTQISQKTSYAFEYRILCADNSVRWVYEKGRGFWDEWGKLQYLDGAIVDITDRKDAEERLQQQARRDRLLNTLAQRIRASLDLQDILEGTVREVRQCLEADRVLIFRLFPDRVGKVVSESVVPGFPKSLGMCFPEEEFPEYCYERYCQGFPRVVADVESDILAPCLLTFMREMGVRSKAIVPILEPSAAHAPLWGLLIAHQCREIRHWHSGEVEMLGQLAAQVGIALQQANLYSQVRASEARLRTMFEQAAVGIAISDLSGRVKEVNRKFGELIGYAPEEIVGMFYHEFTHPDDLKLERQYVYAIECGTRKSYSIEKRYVRKDGSLIWVELTISAFQAGSPEAGCDFLGIVRDIGDRKQAEARLQAQLNFETALAQISRELATQTHVDWSIVLGVLGQTLGVDCVEFFKLDDYLDRWQKSGQWCDPEVKSHLLLVQDLDVGMFPWWMSELHSNRAVAIADVDRLPELAASERSFLQSLGVRSLLDVPILDRSGRLWGFLGLSVSGEVAKAWSPEEAQWLRIIGETIYNYCDRKRAEAALRESEERFRATFEQAAVGIAQIDLTGQLVRVNRRYSELLGYEQAALLQLNLRDLAEHQSHLSEIVNGLLDRTRVAEFDRGHNSVSLERRYICKNGLLRWVHASASLVHDETGAPKYFICALEDIHERKQYQAALENLRHRYELILTSAGEGIFELDPEGTIVFCNPAAAIAIGWSNPGDPIGTPISHLVVESESIETASSSLFPLVVCEVDLDVARVPPFRDNNRICQAVFRRRDGSVFPVDYICTPIRYDGQTIGAVLTFKDITERHAVERMKNEFVSTVSHELRTPMTSMRAALGLLATGKLGQLSVKGQQLVKIALDNTDRLGRLIDDLLDFQRLETGRLRLDRQPHSLRNLLACSVETMQAMAERDSVSLEILPLSEADRSIRLWVDVDRAIQVLTNLLSNAIKFSPPHETVTVRASLLSESLNDVAASRSVCIQIRDRGRGIPENQIERIFDPFYQIDASDSRQKGGTGLGLTICRRLVEQHGGQIWAENLPSGGTQFSIVLPVWEDR